MGDFERVGALAGTGAEIIDLNAGYGAYLRDVVGDANPSPMADARTPPTMIGCIENGEPFLKAARDTIEYVSKAAGAERSLRGPKGENVVYAASGVKILAPIPFPRLIMDFVAFEKHIANSRAKRGLKVPEEWYSIPACYKKNPGSIIGPDEPIIWPSYAEMLDYELEFAVYIGKKGKNISGDHAYNHVFGYSVFNDLSARDAQMKEMKVLLGPFKGKDFDTAGVLGPCIVTAEEVPDPQALEMTARINGEVWSKGNTKDMYWKVPSLIEYTSKDETMYPGYVLGSGTVGFGCGYELGRFIKPGDTVELEIEKLGKIKNTIVKP